MNGDLEQKIDFLREVTAALLDEVKLLGNVKIVEVRNGINFDEKVRDFEKQLIECALDQSDGNQRKAAQLLSLKPSALNEKIKRFAIRLSNEQYEFEDA